jgi:hypothetical protein
MGPSFKATLKFMCLGLKQWQQKTKYLEWTFSRFWKQATHTYEGCKIVEWFVTH